MVKLVPDLTVHRRIDAVRPRHDQRIAHPAAVSIYLVALGQGIADLRPAPRVVRVAATGADVIESVSDSRHVLGKVVEVAKLIEYAGVVALLGCTIVAHGEDEGVVGDTEPFERIEKTPDLRIGVIEHGGEGLLQPTGKGLLGFIEVVPRPHARVTGGEPGVGRNDPKINLLRMDAVTPDVPTLVEKPAVLLEIAVGRVVGGMGCAERQVEQERFFGHQGMLVADH